MLQGLVLGIVLLIAGISMQSAAGTRQESMTTIRQDVLPNLSARAALEENVSSYLELLSTEAQQQVQQAAAAGVSTYIIYSSSGSGRAFHVFLKIPHLRNSKGFFLAGIIVYTGLTALTVVWKLTNGTARVIVDTGIGPHVVQLTGIGYSSFKRNLAGGSGSMVAVSFKQPTLTP